MCIDKKKLRRGKSTEERKKQKKKKKKKKKKKEIYMSYVLVSFVFISSRMMINCF